VEFEIQVSVTGLPDEKTTTVGTPVSAIALTRGAWAPTRLRSLRSTCSPVLNLLLSCSGERETGYHLRCVKSLPQFLLVSRPGSYYDDSDVRLLGCFDCFIESGLIVTPALTSLRVVDSSFVADCGLDSVKRRDAPVLALIDDVISILGQN
jgi:hypothetical protein